MCHKLTKCAHKLFIRSTKALVSINYRKEFNEKKFRLFSWVYVLSSNMFIFDSIKRTPNNSRADPFYCCCRKIEREKYIDRERQRDKKREWEHTYILVGVSQVFPTSGKIFIFEISNLTKNITKWNFDLLEFRDRYEHTGDSKA